MGSDATQSSSGGTWSSGGDATLPDMRSVGERELIRLADRTGMPEPRLRELLRARRGPATAVRYVRKRRLGRGSQGVVELAVDTVLNRHVAIKTLRNSDVSRLLAEIGRGGEGTVAGRLHHPNILDVHDVIIDENDSIGLILPFVPGITLREAIARCHAGDPVWPLARLAEVLATVARALDAAHEQGVVHRDLKPSNVLVSDDEQGAPGGGSAPRTMVKVIDWGLALAQVAGTPVSSVGGGSLHTMAPEQARRAPGWDRRLDVFALGAVLAHMLSGRPLWDGMARDEALARLRDPDGAVELALPDSDPEGLACIALRCLAWDREARPSTAAAVAESLEEWQQRFVVREQARARITQARLLRRRARKLARARDQAAAKARTLRRALARSPDEALRPEAWRLEAEAEQAETDREAALEEAEITLLGALAIAPGLAEARRVLADLVADRHREAETQGAHRRARRLEIRLRAFGGETHREYLEGKGLLTVTTTRPAQARVVRLVEQDRRLVDGPTVWSGPTPVLERRLPMGSYVVLLQPADGPVVRLPVWIRRNQHAIAIPPGATEPLPVPLPRAGDLGPGDIYVPPGWTIMGGDPAAGDRAIQRLTRVWVDGFVIQRQPVTNRGFIAFLNDLVDQGREELALRCAPRQPGVEGQLVYRRTAAGHFEVGCDGDGDVWHEDWIATQLTAAPLPEYAAWWSARTGHTWGLPDESQWVRAARGADARPFVFGAHLEHGWADCRMSRFGRKTPAPLGTFDLDVSVLGVGSLAGGMMEWMSDWYTDDPPVRDGGRWVPVTEGRERALRGGHWDAEALRCRVSYRGSGRPESRSALVGFRLARPFPPR